MNTLSSTSWLRTAGQAAVAAFALTALPNCGAKPQPTPPPDYGARYDIGNTVDSGISDRPTPPMNHLVSNSAVKHLAQHQGRKK